MFFFPHYPKMEVTRGQSIRFLSTSSSGTGKKSLTSNATKEVALSPWVKNNFKIHMMQ
jgi:hypothetical protein